MPRDRDHSIYREWLYLEPDGGLSTAERAQLHRHLLSCYECRKEKEQLPALYELLAESRIPVRSEFRGEVMAALPATAWEARNPRSWIAAAVMLALVSGIAAALVGFGSPDLGSGLPIGGALVAVLELFRSTVLAGAGLMSASWQGLGMAVGELVGGSPVQTAVFVTFVLGVDFLFLRFLMRSWRSTARARAGGSEHSG